MKEKRKQKGSGLFIGDVFFCESERLKKEAGTAFESSQGPKKKKERATMVFDRLLIEGRKFVLDSEDKLREAT